MMMQRDFLFVLVVVAVSLIYPCSAIAAKMNRARRSIGGNCLLNLVCF